MPAASHMIDFYHKSCLSERERKRKNTHQVGRGHGKEKKGRGNNLRLNCTNFAKMGLWGFMAGVG